MSAISLSAPDARLERYCRSERKKVQGWFSRIDAELFLALFALQERLDVRGGTVEIGVHHGKSFIPLCLALRDGEKALCIDIFEEQALNVDRSGEGNRAVFEGNLARFGIGPDKVVVRAGSSMDVTADEIAGAVGDVRFFSVDGGHWRDIVVNDLRLAAATLAPGGIIALDDFLHKAWPDVSRGFFDWQRDEGADFRPVAIGSGKLYLARAAAAQAYLDGLMATEAIRSRIYKTSDFLGVTVPVLIQPYPAFVIALKNRLQSRDSRVFETLMKYKRRFFS